MPQFQIALDANIAHDNHSMLVTELNFSAIFLHSWTRTVHIKILGKNAKGF